MSTEAQAVLSAETKKAFDGIFEGKWVISRECFQSSIRRLKVFKVNSADYDLYLESLQQEKKDFNSEFLIHHRNLHLCYNILMYKHKTVKEIPVRVDELLSYNPKFSPNKESYEGKYDDLLSMKYNSLVDKIKDSYLYCFIQYPEFCDIYRKKRRFLFKLRHA